MGVTVESSMYKDRIEDLKHTGAKVKFLSLEPLLEPLGSLDLSGIDWVILGGGIRPRRTRDESRVGAGCSRPMPDR